MTGTSSQYSKSLKCMIPSDINEDRLKVAKEMGATYVLKVIDQDAHALAKEIEATLGCRPDRSMECSGAASSIATAIHVRTCVYITDTSHMTLVVYSGNSFWRCSSPGGAGSCPSEGPHCGCFG